MYYGQWPRYCANFGTCARYISTLDASNKQDSRMLAVQFFEYLDYVEIRH